MNHFCVFDLDGTLINSLADLADSMNEALRLHGFPTHKADAYRYFVGDGVLLLIKRAAPLNCPEETLKRLHEAFSESYSRRCFHKTKPYDGCRELLSTLLESGCAVAVLSNKPDEFVGRIIKRYYPGIPFAEVRGKRPGYEKKPDPKALLQMIERQRVLKSECLYIGDSNVDVFTAKNAGIRCCGALWGFRGTEELKKAGADFFAQHPLDVLKAVNALSK